MRSITLGADEELPVMPGICFRVTRTCDNVIVSPISNVEYRTFDGSCNNLLPGRENFGSIERAMKRVTPALYDDGMSIIRHIVYVYVFFLCCQMQRK